MVFNKLTEKQLKTLAEHKEKYGVRHYNVMRAHMMRGKSEDESHKLAIEKVKVLPERKKRAKKVKVPKLNAEESVERVKELHEEGYETKEVVLENGDVAVLKKRGRPKKVKTV